MTNPLTVPPLSGLIDFRGGYRLWAVGSGLAFDALPAYADGGPSLVPVAGWNVSTSRLCRVLSSPSVVADDDGMYELSLWCGHYREPERHALHGTRYADKREADRVAYEAGALAFMVYDDHAASRYGLPTA